MKQCNLASSVSSSNESANITFEQAVPKFHYFLFENNAMIALLQEPLGNDQGTYKPRRIGFEKRVS